MKEKIGFMLGVAASLSLVCTQNSSASVLSVSFGRFPTAGTNTSLYTGAGVLNTDTGTVWNTITAPDGTPIAINSDYALDGMTVNLGIAATYNYIGNQNNPTVSLFDGYIYEASGATTINLSGLTIGDDYELVLYSAWGWNNANTTFANGLDSRNLVSGSNHSSFIDGTNYTKFTFTSLASTSISITMSGSNGCLNGFELGHAAATPAPEPSSTVFGFLGVGFAMARRRRP